MNRLVASLALLGLVACSSGSQSPEVIEKIIIVHDNNSAKDGPGDDKDKVVETGTGTDDKGKDKDKDKEKDDEKPLDPGKIGTNWTTAPNAGVSKGGMTTLLQPLPASSCSEGFQELCKDLKKGCDNANDLDKKEKCYIYNGCVNSWYDKQAEYNKAHLDATTPCMLVILEICKDLKPGCDNGTGYDKKEACSFYNNCVNTWWTKLAAE